MKIEQVKKLSPEARFLYWIRERHDIYLRRKAKKPKPWTDDEVMQQYFFTNPYRENDKVTVFFRDNIRGPLCNDPRVLMATVIFRWFNLPATAKVIGDAPNLDFDWDHSRNRSNLFDHWDMEEAVDRLSEVRARKEKVFTGAYMINSPGGEPKLEAICRRINNVWEGRKELLAAFVNEAGEQPVPVTMEQAHGWLTEFDGLGGFMAYEIVCDLRYTFLLQNAVDIMTWCNPGPGCSRGLHRIGNLPFEKGNNSSSPPLPKGWQERMRALLKTVRQKLPNMPLFEMREIEHSLCEYDKYSRALEGDGRMKRTFNGR